MPLVGLGQQCIRHGIQNMYHPSFATRKRSTCSRRPRTSISSRPGIAWLINTAATPSRGHQAGSPVSLEYERELEMCVETMKKMSTGAASASASAAITASPGRRRGPTPAISDLRRRCSLLADGGDPRATKYGGEIMGMGNELGQVKEGYSRPPPGRRRPDRQCSRAAGEGAHPRHHERRQVPPRSRTCRRQGDG